MLAPNGILSASSMATSAGRSANRSIAHRSAGVYSDPMPPERTETRVRSVVKALTYRVVIVCLDFLAIYIFTHKVGVALGFMIVSNVYTTVGYFLHERIWARIRWGREPNAPAGMSAA
jgi:uncharacterized membrane protein